MYSNHWGRGGGGHGFFYIYKLHILPVYVKAKEGGWIRHVNCLYRRTDKALIFNTYVSTNLIMFRTFRISICNPSICLVLGISDLNWRMRIKPTNAFLYKWAMRPILSV